MQNHDMDAYVEIGVHINAAWQNIFYHGSFDMTASKKINILAIRFALLSLDLMFVCMCNRSLGSLFLVSQAVLIFW